MVINKNVFSYNKIQTFLVIFIFKSIFGTRGGLNFANQYK